MAGGVTHDHSHCHTRDARILWIAFALNFPLFVLEVWQGLSANSTSLIADSMDFLSDSFSYLITLYVLNKALSIRARASMLKAALMLMLAVGALYQGIHNLVSGHTPEYMTMGWVSLLALAANLATAAILYSTRDRDSNMASIWLCSRNDALANIGVFIAAGLIYLTDTLWPDLIVALVITYLESSSAIKIIRQARKEMRNTV